MNYTTSHLTWSIWDTFRIPTDQVSPSQTLRCPGACDFPPWGSRGHFDQAMGAGVLRSAVGKTHDLRSDLWWIIPLHILLDRFGIPLGFQPTLAVKLSVSAIIYPRWTATIGHAPDTGFSPKYFVLRVRVLRCSPSIGMHFQGGVSTSPCGEQWDIGYHETEYIDFLHVIALSRRSRQTS